MIHSWYGRSMSGCNVVGQLGGEAAVAHCPVVSRRQDIQTDLLDPFDMLGRAPVDEAGEVGISLYASGGLDTAVR